MFCQYVYWCLATSWCALVPRNFYSMKRSFCPLYSLRLPQKVHFTIPLFSFRFFISISGAPFNAFSQTPSAVYRVSPKGLSGHSPLFLNLTFIEFLRSSKASHNPFNKPAFSFLRFFSLCLTVSSSHSLDLFCLSQWSISLSWTIILSTCEQTCFSGNVCWANYLSSSPPVIFYYVSISGLNK